MTFGHSWSRQHSGISAQGPYQEQGRRPLLYARSDNGYIDGRLRKWLASAEVTVIETTGLYWHFRHAIQLVSNYLSAFEFEKQNNYICAIFCKLKIYVMD